MAKAYTNSPFLQAAFESPHTYHPLGYESVYLPLHKVADTPSHIQRNDISTSNVDNLLVCSTVHFKNDDEIHFIASTKYKQNKICKRCSFECDMGKYSTCSMNK